MESLIIIGGLVVITIFVIGYKIGVEAGKTSSKQAIEVLEKIIFNYKEKDGNDYWRRDYES